jgi:lipoprotein-anchoring transpeptidase ErfK/SrfK
MKHHKFAVWLIAILFSLILPLAGRAEAALAKVAGKLIDVNLTTQQLVAMEQGQAVYRAPVATGKDGFRTPTGSYSIYRKLPLRTMRGSTRGETWVVPNVPHVMYFNGGVALHGAYWHNKFGTGFRLSHGCVNLSLKDAAWLYDWAHVGARVVVHY